jgi:hypothetical protein
MNDITGQLDVGIGGRFVIPETKGLLELRAAGLLVKPVKPKVAWRFGPNLALGLSGSEIFRPLGAGSSRTSLWSLAPGLQIGPSFQVGKRATVSVDAGIRYRYWREEERAVTSASPFHQGQQIYVQELHSIAPTLTVAAEARVHDGTAVKVDLGGTLDLEGGIVVKKQITPDISSVGYTGAQLAVLGSAALFLSTKVSF